MLSHLLSVTCSVDTFLMTTYRYWTRNMTHDDYVLKQNSCDHSPSSCAFSDHSSRLSGGGQYITAQFSTKHYRLYPLRSGHQGKAILCPEMRSPITLLLPLCLSLVQAVFALAPGSYVITNAKFPEQRVVGSDTTNEGVPLGTFNVSL